MALIPPIALDCVVAIGVDAENDEGRSWVASGFFYGQLSEPAERLEDRKYRVALVTNRHVLAGHSKAYLRVNPEEEETAREYPLILVNDDGTETWFGHPNEEVDVAVVMINFGILREEGMRAKYFQNDVHVATTEKMKEIGTTEGDFVFVLGFPMGLVGERRNTVIVRAGSIARMRDTLANPSREFLLDAPIFPGNSGGPVILKPEVIAIQGTKAQNAAHLIGVVKSYVPYLDIAVSQQTGRPRVIFEENSGLAAVHSVDCIEETLEVARKARAERGDPVTAKTYSSDKS